MTLPFKVHRDDPAGWARDLNISREAVDIYLGSEVLDLHIDSFIWTRIWGYDLRERHDHGLLRANFYSQVDFPRILEAALGGATWVITTNPLRAPRERHTTFVENLAALTAIFESAPSQFQIVRTEADYRAARRAGKHGAFLGIQGGHALDLDSDARRVLAARDLIRVTLVHLTSSELGTTSSPLKLGSARDEGLTDLGRRFVAELNASRTLVDLAHISKKGFWDAVAASDRSQPLIVTHTGVDGVFPHWRNLDDDQLRAIADSGGTVGVMFEASFLGDPKFDGKARSVARHLAHIVKTIGAAHASIGSDWDGAISTPRDMPTCLELPRLVEAMLEEGLSPNDISLILGENFLRVVRTIRG